MKIEESLIGVEADSDLTAVLAVLFAEEAATALSAGPLRGYSTEDQSGNVLRGRLRMRDQELRRFGLPLPLEVTVDEWTTDTAENRRLRAANQRLISLADVPSTTRRRLVRLDRVLAGVWNPPRGAVLKPWVPTRLNLRLHRLLYLADLVLDQTTVEHRVGDIEVHGFVLSMSMLFERLVAQLMSENQQQISVLAQRSYPLDSAGHLKIKPDIVCMDGSRVIAVADTKYKLLDEQGKFPNADAYQLVTYCARLGLSFGHLIYSAGELCPSLFDIIGAGVRLVVHAVDLTQSMEDIVLNVKRILDVIRSGDYMVDGAAAPMAQI